MYYPLNQPVRSTFVTNIDGTLTDATTVTLQVMDPAGNETSYTLAASQVVRDSTGTYHYDLTPTIAGHYKLHWYSTGAVATAADESFDVAPRYGWVTLNDVKNRLSIKLTDTTQDVELEAALSSATEVLQNLYGDVIPKQYTERLRPYGAGTRFLTGRSPLTSVDGIQVTWAYLSAPTLTLTAQMYKANLATGEITIFAMTPAFSWQYSMRDWAAAEFDVTYTAGRASIAANVKDAVLELLRLNYAPQRAGGYYPGQGADNDPDAGFTYMGFYIPNGVHERLSGGERPRQIA